MHGNLDRTGDAAVTNALFKRNPAAFACFEEWIQNRKIDCFGTNAGATEIAFQGWRRFKEAFAPELVARAVRESEITVQYCIDPFGGSGTTALACQFLGIAPITIEVNPYLADLIEAKLQSYDIDKLRRTFERLLGRVEDADAGPGLAELKCNAPQTFVQPGVGNRFVFFRDVAARLLRYRASINNIKDPNARRFFRVLLASVAIPVSNVTVSGKGRRYRGGWRERRPRPADVDDLFQRIVQSALKDLSTFGARLNQSYTIIRGDARSLICSSPQSDLAVLSPPYPNSLDYTDVYNVELWTMGYLKNWQSNIGLRKSTLTSHVQLKRNYAAAPSGSPVLDDVMIRIRRRRSKLWHHDIPEMIGAYFADMREVLASLHSRLRPGARAYIVIGDSRYANVLIPSAEILRELAAQNGYSSVSTESFRSMRLAPQQGGGHALAESLLILRRSP